MPFELANRVVTFHRLMNHELGCLTLSRCSVCTNHAHDRKATEQMKNLGLVLDRPKEAELKLKRSKNEFFSDNVNFLDHVLEAGSNNQC